MRDFFRSLAASCYSAEARIASTLVRAWEVCLDYAAWNPEFAGCHIEEVSGQSGSEGQIVGVWAPDDSGKLVPAFYAETIRLVEQAHVVWCVYPDAGDEFLNFVDFSLRPDGGRIHFMVRCYEVVAKERPALDAYKAETAASYERLVAALQRRLEQ